MVNVKKQRVRARKARGFDDEETWEEVVAEARLQEEMLGLEPGTFGPTFFVAGEGEVSKERYLEWCREHGHAL